MSLNCSYKKFLYRWCFCLGLCVGMIVCMVTAYKLILNGLGKHVLLIFFFLIALLDTMLST